MKLQTTRNFERQYTQLRREEPKIADKVKRIVVGLQNGINVGRTEKLQLPGNVWSQRASQKHRVVYKLECGVIYLLRCRGHYDDNG